MGALITIGINALAFYAISKILPGFKIKDEKTAFTIAVFYSFLMLLGSFLVMPLVAIVTLGLSLIAFIPVIGPLLAGSGMLVTAFTLAFGLTAIMLIVIDKMIEDFEMSSLPVAFGASFLLALINVGIRMIF